MITTAKCTRAKTEPRHQAKVTYLFSCLEVDWKTSIVNIFNFFTSMFERKKLKLLLTYRQRQIHT